MATLFDVDYSTRAKSPEELILKNIAWFILPVSYDMLMTLAGVLKMSRADFQKRLTKLINEKKIIEGTNTLFNRKSFFLPKDHLLDLLWQIKDEPAHYYEEIESIQQEYRFYANVRLISQWRDCLFHCAKTGEPYRKPLQFDEEGYMQSLCGEISLHSQWESCYPLLPENTLMHLFFEEMDQSIHSLFPIFGLFYEKMYLENTHLELKSKVVVREMLLFHTYVISGRIQEMDVSEQVLSVDGLCAVALCHQYKGNYKQAVAMYQEAIKKNKEDNLLLFTNPFYNMTYILALMALNEDKSKSKLTALFKKKDLPKFIEYRPAYLLILIALHLPTDSLVSQIKSEFSRQSTLLQYLMLLLLRHYHIDDCSFTSLDLLDEWIDEDHLKLLHLEGSQAFPLFQTRADELRKELGIEPLLAPFQKLEEWEKTIERLMDLSSGATKDKGVAKVSENRIIYYIASDEEIVPRLQKSKDGITWSKGRDVSLTTFKQQAVLGMNDVDRRVSACVRSYSGGWGSSSDVYELGGPKAFAELAGYPLLYYYHNPDVPVVITKEEPTLVVSKVQKGYRVSSNIPPSFSHDSIILLEENGQLYRVLEVSSKQWEIIEAFRRASFFPKDSQERLAALLGRLGQMITIHSDLLQNDESLKTIKGDTMITVQLCPVGDVIKVELFVKPFIDHSPYCKAGEGVNNVIGLVKGERTQAIRDLKREKENLQMVTALLQEVCGDNTVSDQAYFDDYYQCLELIERLRAFPKISRVEWPQGVKFSVNHSADFNQLWLSFKGAGQWFEVDGELVVDEKCKIKISELLEKVRQSKGRFVALTDSDYLALSSQLRKQLDELDHLLYGQKKKLQISRLNMPLLGDMEESGIQIKKDKACLELQKRIEEASQEKFTIPKMLQAELRGYQLDGYHWLSRLAHWGAGACLADDMGLGKTIQAIALMLSRAKQGATLVIAPASVLLNWKAEIERFAPSLNALVMHSNGDRQQLVQNASAYDVVLTTYGLLIYEAEILAGKEWNMIVLDEAHTIKNKETKMAKAAMELKGNFRLMLTGTPIQNHLGEIWTLLQFANPGLLGSFQQFSERFILPIEKEGDKLKQKQLKKILLPFLLRRTKAEVLDELPEKTEISIAVELSADERALYEHLRERALLNIEEGSSTPMQTLAEITRLRQAACHPALINASLNLASSKTAAFLGLVDELIENRHRALVFSQFTSHLALVRKELEVRGIDYLYLDGSVSVNERAVLVKKFQTGEQPLFLISLKAGGTGLNLTAADYVIHLDPWWNPAVEDQASDRVHRIGQTRPVTIYRLIAAQTIEEKIIKLHQSKKSLADSLLDGSDISHKLTKEEMLDLMRSVN